MRAQNPETPEEWQAAVNAAHAMLTLESMRRYGLMTGGPEVNLKRCRQILARGKTRGVEPEPGSDIRYLRGLMGLPPGED